MNINSSLGLHIFSSSRGCPAIFIILLVINVPYHANAQHLSVQHWTEDIFFSVSGQYYIIPDLAGAASPNLAQQYGVSTGFIPYPGFRAAAGYEWKNWLFSVESGFSYIKGDNPLVINIYIIPLILKAGYSFFPISEYKQFTLTPTAAFGTVFASVDHYKDAIDILLNIESHSANNGLFIQAGVRAGWQPFSSNKILEFFAGFSVDCIIEKDGIIPMPQLELGVIIRPFARSRAVPIISVVQEETKKEKIEEAVIKPFIIEEEVLEYKRESFLFLFDSDSFTLTEEELIELDKAALAFNKYKEIKIILRGYAAPYPSIWGQTELSRQRALFCAAYLMEEHNILEEYLVIEWMGSGSLPEDTEEDDIPRRRSVEIIIEGWLHP